MANRTVFRSALTVAAVFVGLIVLGSHGRTGISYVLKGSVATAVSQHAVSTAVKRARFMALLPYVGD